MAAAAAMRGTHRPIGWTVARDARTVPRGSAPQAGSRRCPAAAAAGARLAERGGDRKGPDGTHDGPRALRAACCTPRSLAHLRAARLRRRGDEWCGPEGNAATRPAP